MADETKKRCKGISRQSGERCRCKAVKGSNYCMFHGGGALGNKGGAKKGTPKPPGAGGPAWGNTNAVKHGGYSARLLPNEQPYFDAIKAEFEEDLGGVEKLSASDRMLVDWLATNGAKIASAQEKGAGPEVVVPLQRLGLEILRELKTTRASKGDPSGGGNSPAEVVAALLMKVRDHALSVQQRPALPQEASDDDVVEGEVVDAEAGDDA